MNCQLYGAVVKSSQCGKLKFPNICHRASRFINCLLYFQGGSRAESLSDEQISKLFPDSSSGNFNLLGKSIWNVRTIFVNGRQLVST